MEPLNGVKTHPLSAHALECLRRLTLGPIPRQELNPGVVNRLERETLVEGFMAPSPYRTRKLNVQMLRITAAGRERIALIDRALDEPRPVSAS